MAAVCFRKREVLICVPCIKVFRRDFVYTCAQPENSKYKCKKNLPVYNAFKGRLLQTRTTKTANITKDYTSITSHYIDISAMCCAVI